MRDGIALKVERGFETNCGNLRCLCDTEASPLHKSLIKKVNDLDTIFANINAQQTLGVHSLNLNPQNIRRGRLEVIIDMSSNVQHSRQKRVLADFGGDILHFLFGVVTTQLKKFEDTLADVAKSQLAMSH